MNMNTPRKYDSFADDCHNDYQPTQQSSHTPLFSSINYDNYTKQCQLQQPRSSFSFTDNRRDSSSYAFNQSSFTSFEKPEQEDHSKNLQILQQKLTQEILCLRQQKLTLMEQHNQIIQNRYKIQREVHKLKKRIQKQQQQKLGNSFSATNLGIISKSKTSPNIYKFIQQNADYNSLTQEECSIMQKILNLKHANNQLEFELNQISATNKPKKQQTKNIHSYILKLQQKRQKLMKTVIELTPQQTLSNSLGKLWQTNTNLQILMNNYIEKRTQTKRKLQELRQRVKKDEQIKKQMLEQVISIKSKVKCLKLENQQFKNAYNLFRF